MISIRLLAGVALLAIASTPSTVGAQNIDKYRPVTQERLIKPEPENWLMYRGSYDGFGYSALDKINTRNVKNLVPVWSFSTGMLEGHQSPPIVNDGIMFVTTPNGQVLAFNASNGELLWRYARELPEDLVQAHPTNRGVALFEDKVYVATVDAHVVALDARTGKVVWDTAAGEYKNGYYFTLALLIAKGKVMVGTSGGEFGIRGYIAALDAQTGKEVWRTHMIPGPGEPGNETWPGETWKTGGVSVWITGHYDPQLGLAYWGTGNAGPWPADMHTGDNLYATSVVALDVDTGKIRGHHQYHWNDNWDWDEVSAPLLIDVPRNGRTIKALVHPGRNGYLWILERNADGIKFVEAQPFVKHNVITSLDPKTGRPVYDTDRVLRSGKTVTLCPSHWGGKDWPPAAYNPKTQLLYVPAHENLCSTLVGEDKTPAYDAGKRYVGTNAALTKVFMAPGADHIGELQAWDLKTGKKVWTHNHQYMNWGPVLTTGGGLVFSGGTNDRYFRAFDAETGKVLWQYRTNSGVTGVPSSFSVDGVQYIAVQSGWGVDAQKMQTRLNNSMGTNTYVPQGGVIWVFAVR